jgi:hypothetical protein|tara:strand:- start:811 stop:927 length:117 start_codon:yes stop_codon:yes gene_type:complete
MDKSFDNSLVLNEDIINSLENMLKYQNYKLKEMIKKSI